MVSKEKNEKRVKKIKSPLDEKIEELIKMYPLLTKEEHSCVFSTNDSRYLNENQIDFWYKTTFSLPANELAKEIYSFRDNPHTYFFNVWKKLRGF